MGKFVRSDVEILDSVRARESRRGRYVRRSAARLGGKALLVVACTAALRPFLPELLRDWLGDAGASDPAQRAGELWKAGVWSVLLVIVGMTALLVVRAAAGGMSKIDRLTWRLEDLERHQAAPPSTTLAAGGRSNPSLNRWMPNRAGSSVGRER